MKPLVIIPMAGQSSRFRDWGYEVPKWALRIADKPVIWWALQSVLPLQNSGAELRIIVKESELDIAFETLDELQDLVEIFSISHATRGQAETVNLSLVSELDLMRPLLIWNCDSLIVPRFLSILNWQNAFVVHSDLEGDHWSFFRFNHEEELIEAREKQRISNHCSLGMYGFSSIQQFRTALESTDFSAQKELFVAPIYNEIVKGGQVVKSIEIRPEAFLSFGTPREYLDSKFRIELNPKNYAFQ